MNEISKEYDTLKESYIPEIKMPIVDNLRWKDDFRFFYSLCLVFLKI